MDIPFPDFFRDLGVNAEHRQQETAQDGSGTPIKKRNNPTGESVAPLVTSAVQILSAGYTRAPSSGSNATL